MSNWYCKQNSLVKLIVWDETGTVSRTYHSKLKLDKFGPRRSEDDLVKRLYLENKTRNWKTAITYNNQTGEQLAKWVDKVRVE